ncbi:MAG: 6-carboxytetrahydropterin synthase QueD [Candidatus Omnitrophica bacterium]|nr:6-carboxytetrahydropterin synthase QueD [Candidatus Omnitrophota bacterium]
MYTITVRSRFSSAHNLRGYKGKCEELHGHNWSVELTAASSDLDELGMVMDFTDLKRELGEILFLLDHKYLNNVVPFDTVNPTSENIAKYIYSKMKIRIPVKIVRVTVWETEGASATYSE